MEILDNKQSIIKTEKEGKESAIFTDFTSLPPKILQNYTNFVDKTENHGTCHYKTFDATSIKNKRKYIIRVLNTESEFIKTNRDHVITLFLQELFYICTTIDNLHDFNIEDFTFAEGQIAFVLPQKVVSLKDMISQAKAANEVLDVEESLKKIISELYFLEKRLKLTFNNIVPEKIFSLGDRFFLTDWAAGQQLHSNEQAELEREIEEKKSNEDSQDDDTSSNESIKAADSDNLVTSDDADQIADLALIGLEIKSINMTRFDSSLVMGWKCGIVGKISRVLRKMNQIVDGLKTIPNESDIKGFIISNKLNLGSGEVILRSIYKTLASDSLLIAYCSNENDRIQIYDSRTGEIFSCEGGGFKYSHSNFLQSVPGSNLLIYSSSAKNQSIFNVF